MIDLTGNVFVPGLKERESTGRKSWTHREMNSRSGSILCNEDVVRSTTMIAVPRLSKRLGIDLVIASEAFQHTGSFKFRGAYNVASHVPEDLLITASSGNYGQALAYACSLQKKSCIVVMPTTSAAVKIDAVREYGGQVELVDVLVKSRVDRVAELARLHPGAYLANAADDALAIEGYSSLGRELSSLRPMPDTVVAPVGGGGLISGILLGAKGKGMRVVGAEPLLANDAARSLRAGKIVVDSIESPTIADGARALTLGKRNWEIMHGALSTIIEVPEETIVEAVRLLFELANLKVEPTGALGVAAVMAQPELFRGESVCCVVSGGNVDPAVYAHILAG
jgi:threonine dehydratase